MAKHDVEVRIKGDSRGLDEAIDGADRKMRGLGDGLSKLGAGIATAGAVGIAAVGAGLAFSVDAASNLGEAINAVNVTFGESAEGIKKLGEEAATAVGLSNTEFNGLAVQFSSFANNIAGPGGDVVGVIDDMTTRAADFASVMNLDVADAAAMFQSGLAGETEPLKKFGLDLSAAAVETYALANGIIGAGEEMTEAQKVQARYGALMEQTAKTSGDFANTSDGLANQQRILKAQLTDVAAKVGTALLPILAKLATFVGDKLVPFMEKYLPQALDIAMEAFAALRPIIDGITDAIKFVASNIEYFLPILGAIVAVVIAGFVPALVAWATATWAQVAAQAALLGPIILVAAGIAALVAGVIYAYQHFEGFRAIVDGVATWMRDTLWPAIQTVATGIADAFGALVGFVQEHWDKIQAIIEVVWNAISIYIETVIGVIRGIIETVMALIKGDWDGVWNGIQATAQAVWDGITALIQLGLDTIKAILTGAWDGIKAAAATIWDGLKNAAQEAWDGIVTGVTELPGRLAESFTDLFNAGKDLGGEIVDGIESGLKKLVSTGLGIAQAMANAIISFFNTNVIDKINNLLEFTVSIPTSPFTQQDFHVDPRDIPHIPTFHTGGIVPGSMGAEVPIMAQAGEMVLTRAQQSALLGGSGAGISIGQLVTSRPGETVEELRRLQWLEAAA